MTRYKSRVEYAVKETENYGLPFQIDRAIMASAFQVIIILLFLSIVGGKYARWKSDGF